MWVLTVASVTKSRPAIWVLVRPAAIRARTSASRVVSPSGSGAAAAGRDGAVCRCGGEQSGVHGGVEDGLPGGGGVQGAGDLGAAGVLGEVAQGAGVQRGQDVGVVGEGGEHDDLGVGVLGADPGGRGDPVDDGHGKVHQHHVGVQLGGQGDGLFAVGGGADDLDAGGQAEQGDQAFPDRGLVVGDQHPQRRSRSRVRELSGVPVMAPGG